MIVVICTFFIRICRCCSLTHNKEKKRGPEDRRKDTVDDRLTFLAAATMTLLMNVAGKIFLLSVVQFFPLFADLTYCCFLSVALPAGPIRAHSWPWRKTRCTPRHWSETVVLVDCMARDRRFSAASAKHKAAARPL